ncbi:MAG: hypothetical protein KF898_01645 [Parachlamydiales bacterium]|nr:hypothetical protein [Candidatus Acheromyda pituitae]
MDTGPHEDYPSASSDPSSLTGLLFSIYQNLPPKKGLPQLLSIMDEALLSYLTDQSSLQESIRVRGLQRARIIAASLIDEKGEFLQTALTQWIDLFEKEGYLFYADGFNDSCLTEHTLAILKKLRDDGSLVQLLKRFQKPLCSSWAEEIVRQSLGLYQHNGLTDAQIRIAVLSALLTPLRQNVGSCFATAPAIFIQREQPQNLLEDLHQLLTLGKLKRIFGGVEYSVPISPSTGIGDLRRPVASPHSLSKPWLSPGLMLACTISGLIQEGLNWEKKAEKLKELLDWELKGEKSATVEQFLHRALLELYGLTDGDIEMAARLELTRAKSSKLSQSYAAPGSSEKIDLSHKFARVEKLARAAFKGFSDHALLKAWEFTLASFSEVKMEFSRWNLYSSLGLHHEERGGIGEVVYHHLEEKIAEANQNIQKYQTEYEIAFDQVRATEALLKNAGSESEVRRLQAEFQSRAYHMRACLEMRDKSYAVGSNYSNLFAFLVKQYDAKFPEYFQEIYDAEMQDVQGDIYDDSPAGFRLVYKHGRSDPALWTLIYNAEQYIESLAEFFNATESEIAANCDWEGGDREVLGITSAIVNHVRTPLFLETALQRMAKVHLGGGLPGKAEEKKPWVYTSGGTMTTLLKTYYRRQGELTEESRWVENETELLIFLIDCVKNQPPYVTDLFAKNTQQSLLMASPSHAFLLQPSIRLYKEGWQEEGFTYTWVRDQVFSPSHQFYARMLLDSQEQQLLIDLFSAELPPLLSHHLHKTFSPTKDPLKIIPFRTKVLECLISASASPNSEYRRAAAEKIDSFLYQTLPIVPGREFKVILRRLFGDRFDEKISEAMQAFADVPSPLMTGKMIKEAAKFCWIKAYQKIGYSFDLHQHIAQHARFLNISPPTPFIFADTNWANFYFGFVINPGTGRLELWRVDRTASQGMPMSSWQHWINGADKKNWSVYVRPSEYSIQTSILDTRPRA